MKPHNNILNLRVVFLFFMLVLIIFSCNQKGDPTMEKILIITGGHDFEPSFYEIFDSFVNVQYDTISQPKFNQMITSGIPDQYSALVFYDMWQEIDDEEKDAYVSLLESGQGIVYLHHALVAYQHWEEFMKRKK